VPADRRGPAGHRAGAGRPAPAPAPGRRARGPRPLPDRAALFTPGASPLREQLERRSAAPLLWLHQLPAWAPPLGMVALMLAGLAAPVPVAVPALGALAALLSWLAAVSWPRLPAQARLLRVAAVAMILAAAVARALR